MNNKVIFAVDEIQEFNSDDKILSYQINDFENIGSSFDNKEKLYPLNHCIQQSLLALQVYGFISGTKFTMKDVELIRSPCNSQKSFVIFDFDRCSNPIDFLKNVINLEDSDFQTLSDESRKKLKKFSGRYRFITFLIQAIINKNPSGNLLNQDKVKIIEECIDGALASIVSSIDSVCKGANEQDFNFLTRGLYESFFVSPSTIPPSCFNIFYKLPNKNVNNIINIENNIESFEYVKMKVLL